MNRLSNFSKEMLLENSQTFAFQKINRYSNQLSAQVSRCTVFNATKQVENLKVSLKKSKIEKIFWSFMLPLETYNGVILSNSDEVCCRLRTCAEKIRFSTLNKNTWRESYLCYGIKKATASFWDTSPQHHFSTAQHKKQLQLQNHVLQNFSKAGMNTKEHRPSPEKNRTQQPFPKNRLHTTLLNVRPLYP